MPTIEARARLARFDAVGLAFVAFALRIPAFAADRHFHPDDGTYGMSAVAMRHGAAPFRTVFSSQGPFHLVTVWLGDVLTGRQMNSPRAAAVAFGVVATVATAAIGARLAGRAGAIVAGLLVATSGSMLWTSGPLTADAPTIALVALALLAAMRYDEAPGTGRAVVVGAIVGAGLMCKVAVAIVGFLPAVAVLVVTAAGRPRDHAGRVRHVVAAGAAALLVGVALVMPFGPAEVWDQAIRYQLATERERSILGNASKVVTTLWARDLVVAALVLVALALLIARRPRRREAAVAGLWLITMLGFLVVQPALWRNHLSHAIVPAAVFVVAVLGDAHRRGRSTLRTRRTAVALLVVAVAIQARFLQSILVPPPYDSTTADAVTAVRTVPEGGRIVTDEIGIVWRAGRRTPDDLVDFSIKQIQQERVTLPRLVAVARRADVCGVLVWSAKHLGSFADLPDELGRLGYEARARFPGQLDRRALYVKRDCAPGG